MILRQINSRRIRAAIRMFKNKRYRNRMKCRGYPGNREADESSETFCYGKLLRQSLFDIHIQFEVIISAQEVTNVSFMGRMPSSSSAISGISPSA